MSEITFEHALDGLRHVLRLHVAIDLAAERRVGTKTTTDIDVIALDAVFFGNRNLAGEQADIADVMLGAGMMATGEMDIDRAVENDARLAALRNLLGMSLGVGCRKAASDIAGAGDEAGTDRRGRGGKAERSNCGLHARDPLVGHP